jgi:hypothetical protein
MEQALAELVAMDGTKKLAIKRERSVISTCTHSMSP